jgi:hypothetical protein
MSRYEQTQHLEHRSTKAHRRYQQIAHRDLHTAESLALDRDELDAESDPARA